MINKKVVVVINGKGGAGKDTLCSFVAEKYRVMNISAITPIKEMARILGWNGEKDNRSRKLLSDLKMIAIEYNDFPNVYLLTQYKLFSNSEYDILFVHIRETEQIDHFISSLNCHVVTLLIRRNNNVITYGNFSDDNVELYNYDYIYENIKTLSKAKDDFLSFFEDILEEIGDNY